MLHQSSNIGLEYNVVMTHFQSDDNSWMSRFDTRLTKVVHCVCLVRVWFWRYYAGQVVYSRPSHCRMWWQLRFGKRLTWRRSQHGLVGWEMTVNSDLFSQLPVETNTNDYPSIVLNGATRHCECRLNHMLCGAVWMGWLLFFEHVVVRTVCFL